ncbi:helix-turn-helix domain-containing protein [Streptococcus uberis]|uniref:helix-turn-helix domain-containing protein n=1 Tax=Streptococcus uberis TaxID=1349 RepID=UPI0006204791|nr:helix-turn-helix transcriptional regulator [Streptococcus uberis]KKF45946.1 Cro/Cl family transcriptional regulator [Streptococcus uberis C5072]MCK1222611.1 helix-turn-helix domain-containing protein [Streptococcus uberis]QBX31240.1 Cro-like phage transcriptional repressor protein [Streptococcus phage Javan626]
MDNHVTTIAELRAKNGKMSQSALAEKLGVSQATVSSWEDDISSIKGRHLIMLCQEFKVRSSDLLGV